MTGIRRAECDNRYSGKHIYDHFLLLFTDYRI